MIEWLLKFGPLTGALTLAGAILTVFSWLDTHFSDTGKKEVAIWLRGEHEWTRLQESVKRAYTITFGNRILSFRGFLRSTIVSTLFVLLLSIVYVLHNKAFWTNQGYTADIDWDVRIRYFFMMLLIINIPSDYGCAIISKFYIDSEAKIHRSLKVLAYLFFGVTCVSLYLVLTAFIDTTFFLADPTNDHVFRITPYRTLSDVLDFDADLRYLRSGLLWEPVIQWGGASVTPWYEIFSYGPFICSGLMIFAWMGIYISSGFFIKTLKKLDPLWIIWMKYFDVDKFPLKCIGAVAAALTGFGYLLISGFLSIV